jgi:hypothetical protein
MIEEVDFKNPRAGYNSEKPRYLSGTVKPSVVTSRPWSSVPANVASVPFSRECADFGVRWSDRQHMRFASLSDELSSTLTERFPPEAWR